MLEGKYEYVKQSLEADLEAANERIKHITGRNQQLGKYCIFNINDVRLVKLSEELY